MVYNFGLTIGLTVTDIDKMTAGEVFDLAYYKINLMDKQPNEPKGRKASQEDYDAF